MNQQPKFAPYLGRAGWERPDRTDTTMSWGSLCRLLFILFLLTPLWVLLAWVLELLFT
jgi:hypothetical protein